MQPEAKFKSALTDGFDVVFGNKSKRAFWAYMKCTKDGMPDLFFAALGRSVWAEGKVNDNGLKKSQRVTIPRMVAGGAIVKIIESMHRPYKRVDRPVKVSQPWQAHTPPWVIYGWHHFNTLPFWERFMEAA